MLLPNIFSFKLVTRETLESMVLPVPIAPARTSPALPAALPDANKRAFLKVAGVAGLGVLATSVLPQQAQGYVLGSAPTSGVIGVKDSTNTRINPATEESLQELVAGQVVEKVTTTLGASGTVHTPGSGKKLRVYSTRFSMTADLTSVAFRFGAGGTNHELYLAPKTGGLYGSNNHPNYVEGAVDEVLYCVISGSASVQVNIDYAEV